MSLSFSKGLKCLAQGTTWVLERLPQGMNFVAIAASVIVFGVVMKKDITVAKVVGIFKTQTTQVSQQLP